MSRFYFHICDGDDVHPDSGGTMLPDICAIIGQALKLARATLSAEALEGSMPMNKRIEVRDASGTLVHTLPFVNAVEFKFNARHKYGLPQISFPTLGFTGCLHS